MNDELLSFGAGFFFGLILGTIATIASIHNHFENRTVKDGKAEYYLDENHEKQWRWKP